MSGWKTKLGGIAMILGGVAQGIKSLVDLFNGGSGEGLQEAIMMVGAGLGIIGIGHKIEKAAK